MLNLCNKTHAHSVSGTAATICANETQLDKPPTKILHRCICTTFGGRHTCRIHAIFEAKTREKIIMCNLSLPSQSTPDIGFKNVIKKKKRHVWIGPFICFLQVPFTVGGGREIKDTLIPEQMCSLKTKPVLFTHLNEPKKFHPSLHVALEFLWRYVSHVGRVSGHELFPRGARYQTLKIIILHNVDIVKTANQFPMNKVLSETFGWAHPLSCPLWRSLILQEPPQRAATSWEIIMHLSL